MLYYEDIFASIQGESSKAGKPCVFVRLHGCNIGCIYCDQKQDKIAKKRIGIDRLLKTVLDFHIPRVCITGGEPLLQPEIYPVIYELVNKGLDVSVETSGCVPIDDDTTYNRKFNYVMDVKCPSSGVSHKNIYENLARLKPIDEVKFVVANKKDYDFARDVMRKYPTNAQILFSPVMIPDPEDPTKWRSTVSCSLIEWILKDGLSNVRVQIQLHKYLGVK